MLCSWIGLGFTHSYLFLRQNVPVSSCFLHYAQENRLVSCHLDWIHAPAPTQYSTVPTFRSKITSVSRNSRTFCVKSSLWVLHFRLRELFQSWSINVWAALCCCLLKWSRWGHLFLNIRLLLCAVSLWNSHKLERRGHEMDKTEVGHAEMLWKV